MLETVDSNSKTPLRDKAIILLAFNSGLRGVDIRNLKLTDICWEKQELRIVQSKTGKPVAAPLQGKTLNPIADYILSERPKCESDCVFIRSYPAYTGLSSTSPLDYMVDKYCRLAGIPKKSYRSFHSLRRGRGHLVMSFWNELESAYADAVLADFTQRNLLDFMDWLQAKKKKTESPQ